MKRVLLAFAVAATGCADNFVPLNDLGVRDFSPSDRASDLSMPGDGMETVDLGMSDQAAAPDLTIVTHPDLSMPPDLSMLTCDLGTASGDAGSGGALYFAEVSAGAKSLVTARFDAALGTWSGSALDASQMLYDVAIAIGAGSQPLVVGRLTDNVLYSTSLQPCTGAYPALSPVYMQLDTTDHRPALAGGALPELVFKGTNAGDTHLYDTILSSGGWAAATQQTFLTNLGPVAVRVGGAVHAIHTGTNNTVYDGPIGAAAVAVTGATSAFSPAAVVTADGTTHVVFVGMDTNKNLYYASRPSGGSYSTPQLLCNGVGGCFATSDKAPFLALAAGGEPIVAFHGTDLHTYTSMFGGTTGSSPIAADGGETTDVEPAIASGVGSAIAELVYVRKSDGLPRHARLSGTWGQFATVSTTAVAAIPALASLP
jgi:hypothetical protein